jgi:hypothetical protein
MRRGFLCYRTFPVTAGLAMPYEKAHPAGYRRLGRRQKLEACGGSVGGDDTFRNLLRKQLTARSPPTQIFMLEWHNQNS